MTKIEQVAHGSCYVCGEEKHTEIHCSSHSYAYDNDDFRFTEEVCWQICEDCLGEIEEAEVN